MVMETVAAAGQIAETLGTIKDLFGGSGLSERKQMAAQAAYNREVMQNQLQWKAEDAKKAGIHPLYAMGSPTATFNAQSVGAPESIGSKMQKMGQSLQRASQANQDTQARLKQNVMDDLQMEKTRAEINLLNSQATAVGRPTTPSIGRSGSAGSATGAFVTLPDEITSTRPGVPSTSAAPPKPAASQFINRDGTVIHLPSPEAKNAIEDSLMEYEWMWRNRISPFIDRGRPNRNVFKDIYNSKSKRR